jgi:hypothetical protein
MERSSWLRALSLGAFAMNDLPHGSAYHIFCDEYGDQSLNHTASEWFILSAVVVAAHRVPDLQAWIRRIKRPMKNQQRLGLHFKDLDERMKLRSTRFLGKMPIRCFALLCHKENMRNHRNWRCEHAVGWFDDDDIREIVQNRGRRQSYPNFVLKVLLERATEWCERRSILDYGVRRPVQITIASRGGFYLDSFKRYLIEKDRVNWLKERGTLPGFLAWRVVDTDLISEAPAANVAGLQIADVVAGAFSRAIDESAFGMCDRRYVENLMPRIGKRRWQIASFGVTGLPWKLSRAPLSGEQQRLFRICGYGRKTLVRPGPILPSGE